MLLLLLLFAPAFAPCRFGYSHISPKSILNPGPKWDGKSIAILGLSSQQAHGLARQRLANTNPGRRPLSDHRKLRLSSYFPALGPCRIPEFEYHRGAPPQESDAASFGPRLFQRASEGEVYEAVP